MYSPHAAARLHRVPMASKGQNYEFYYFYSLFFLFIVFLANLLTTRCNRAANVIKLVWFTLNTQTKLKVDKEIIHIESIRIYTINLMYSYLFYRFCMFCVPNLMTLIVRQQGVIRRSF